LLTIRYAKNNPLDDEAVSYQSPYFLVQKMIDSDDEKSARRKSSV